MLKQCESNNPLHPSAGRNGESHEKFVRAAKRVQIQRIKQGVFIASTNEFSGKIAVKGIPIVELHTMRVQLRTDKEAIPSFRVGFSPVLHESVNLRVIDKREHAEILP